MECARKRACVCVRVRLCEHWIKEGSRVEEVSWTCDKEKEEDRSGRRGAAVRELKKVNG